jgi:hypothetical protein
MELVLMCKFSLGIQPGLCCRIGWLGGYLTTLSVSRLFLCGNRLFTRKHFHCTETNLISSMLTNFKKLRNALKQ